jgi:hypothetical protein
MSRPSKILVAGKPVQPILEKPRLTIELPPAVYEELERRSSNRECDSPGITVEAIGRVKEKPK